MHAPAIQLRLTPASPLARYGVSALVLVVLDVQGLLVGGLAPGHVLAKVGLGVGDGARDELILSRLDVVRLAGWIDGGRVDGLSATAIDRLIDRSID